METKKKTSVGFLVFYTLCRYQCTGQKKINTVFAVIGTGSTLPSPSTNTIVVPPPFPLCYYFFSRVWQVEVLTILASRGGGWREVESALSLFYLFLMQCNQFFFSTHFGLNSQKYKMGDINKGVAKTLWLARKIYKKCIILNTASTTAP